MNRIKAKFIKFLPEIGILILSSSFFLNWFSCTIGIGSKLEKNLSYYFDLFKSNHNIGLAFYPSCLAFYLLSLALAIHFLKRLDLKRFFLLFSLFLFLNLILMAWGEKELGYHNTIDIPCYPDFGFWLHTLGLAVITIGSWFRLRKHA